MKTMFAAKLKSVLACVVACAFVGGSAAVGWQEGQQGKLRAAVVASPTAQTAQLQDKDLTDRINGLVEKLGSAKFADREKAMKELESIGPDALPVLRPALKSPVAEVRQRVEMLVRRFEERQIATQLLTAKRLRLNVKDATVAQSVAELAKVSGYPIALVDGAKAQNDRKITLDTGDTTFWEAVDKLSLTAGLVEPPVGAPGAIGRLGGKGGINQPAIAWAAFPAADINLRLAAGKPANLPTHYAGSVRVRMLKTATSANGEIDLTLEVIGEARLVGFAAAGSPRIDKALDDLGQALTGIPVPVPANALPGPLNGGVGNNGIGNGIGNGNVGNGNNGNFQIGNGAALAGFSGGPAAYFKPFQVTVRLQPGEKPAKKLQELSGKIGVHTLVDSEPLVVVDKILDASGKTVKGKNETSLTINKVEKLANGDIRVQVSTGDAGQNPLGGIIQIQGAGKVQIIGNKIVIGGGDNRGPTSPLRLLDAKGESYTQVETVSNGITLNGAQFSQAETVLFRPRAGQGPPARLVLPGQQAFVFDVGFSFKDVVISH